MSDGLCECGCGSMPAIATKTNSARGAIKGLPQRFVYGHNSKTSGRSDRINADGYSDTWSDGKYKRAHVLIAEKALGRPLPDGVIVHHIDEDRQHNENSNLVICQNAGYHQFIHKRMRAYIESGHPNYERCWICRKYDDPENLAHRSPRSRPWYHEKCRREYRRMH